jgi:DNA-directed RNA polymerase specialized sigma24 family protein
MRRPAVKAALTPKRRTRPVVENDTYAQFARRVVACYGRRIGRDGDVDALAELVAFADHLDIAVQAAVTGLREHGYSWAEIARRLGITRQAAQQRWVTTAPDGGDRS